MLDLSSTLLGSPLWYSKKSPMEIFLDDDMFKSTIRKCWNWEQKHYKGEDPNGERNVFHENRLRQSIKIYSGTQSVSNFRPTQKTNL